MCIIEKVHISTLRICIFYEFFFTNALIIYVSLNALSQSFLSYKEKKISGKYWFSEDLDLVYILNLYIYICI